MEIDEFVKSVLVKIVTGIKEAQETEGVGAFIVPTGDGGHEYAKNSRVSSSARLKSTIVEFDVALTVEAVDKTSGGGGLRVAGIGANLEGESLSKDTQISRIQFGVPILLPESQKSWHEELKGKKE